MIEEAREILVRDKNRDELEKVFRKTFNDDSISINDNMTASDIEAWDSLNHIKLIIAVEEHFKTRFSNAEVARLTNIGNLINLINKKINP
jgi:acyl carrier protein